MLRLRVTKIVEQINFKRAEDELEAKNNHGQNI